MCGPSAEMKKLNQQVQAFSTKITDEAGTIFGEANDVFNNIVNATKQIVNGGPSQMGFSAAELSAKNAAAVQAGATEARNLKAATAGALSAIGGGTFVNPAGSTQQIMFDANAKAAEDTAASLNEIQREGFETGRSNFWNATKTELAAPSVLGAANEANKTAMEGQKQAMTSQQSIDTANNWWQPLLEKGVMAGVDAFTGGIGGGLAKKIMPGGNTGGGWNTADIGSATDDFLNQQS